MWNLIQAGSSDQAIKPKNDNKREISFFDVKELYEKAYAYKAENMDDNARFNVLMARAQRLDKAYRVQLALKQTTRYEKKAA